MLPLSEKKDVLWGIDRCAFLFPKQTIKTELAMVAWAMEAARRASGKRLTYSPNGTYLFIITHSHSYATWICLRLNHRPFISWAAVRQLLKSPNIRYTLPSEFLSTKQWRTFPYFWHSLFTSSYMSSPLITLTWISISQFGSVSSAGVNMLRRTMQLLAFPWMIGLPSAPNPYR